MLNNNLKPLDKNILSQLKIWNDLTDQQSNNIKSIIGDILKTHFNISFNNIKMSVQIFYLNKKSSTENRIPEPIKPNLDALKLDIDEYELIVFLDKDNITNEDFENNSYHIILNENGEFIEISLINSIDLESNEKENSLLPFPIKFNEYRIEETKDEIFLINNNNNERTLLKVQSLFNNYPTYVPFLEHVYKEEQNNEITKNEEVTNNFFLNIPFISSLFSFLFKNNEETNEEINQEKIKYDYYIRYCHYDKPNLYAFLISRYAFGLNPCCVYVNIETNKIYLDYAPNYDYPQGLFIRKINENEADIYLSVENKKVNYLYKNTNLKRKTDVIRFDNVNSNWYPLSIEKKFNRLEKCIIYTESNNIDNLENFFLNEIKKSYELTINKNHNEAIVSYLNLIDIHTLTDICENQMFYVYYNLACNYSLIKNKESAIKYLKLAYNTTYFDYVQYEKDTDLDFIRNESEILDLIKLKD